MKRFPLIPMTPPIRHVAAVASFLLLGACASAFDRAINLGEPLPLAQIENPLQAPTYQPLNMPMPAPAFVARQANSLWRPGAKAFFRDQRAARVGDILTVNVAIADQANVANTTNRSREAAEDADVTNLFGLEAEFGKVMPQAIVPAAVVSLGNKSSTKGAGAVARSETINLTVAALVLQILPNGNMVIQGHQEVRVNFEIRELTVTGIVRPEDITASNTISHTQIAEARISYGGRGQITDVQQARYGQQLLDIIAPF
jgi:flagellar L-ring protein precursor FlgH